MNRLRRLFATALGTRSYAQCGEDLIMAFALRSLGVSRPRYLDIGAHHPTRLSNTYYFYRQGSSGVCVEPDPLACATIQRTRRRDVCLNVGVADREQVDAVFYVLSARTLSTFSKADVERYLSYGQQRVVEELRVPCVPVNTILAEHFADAPPDIVSIDIEGYDLDVLQSWDFDRYRPTLICAETLSYTEDKTEEKLQATIDFVTDQGYRLYADTYINSIFVDRDRWSRR